MPRSYAAAMTPGASLIGVIPIVVSYAALAPTDGELYTSESARLAALPAWVHEYNHHRPHSVIGKRSPISRLDNLAGHDSQLVAKCPDLPRPRTLTSP